MTHFQESWLKRVDSTGHNVFDWATKHPSDAFKGICTIFNAIIKTERGFDKLNQHASTKKHKSNLFKIKPNQFRLAVNHNSAETNQESNIDLQDKEVLIDSSNSNINHVELNESTPVINQIQKSMNINKKSSKKDGNQNVNQNSSNQTSNKLTIFSVKDESTKAELYYLLDLIKHNLPLSQCDGKKKLFQAMFPGSISSNFTLSRTKATYILNFALGPYFKKEKLSELQENNVYFTLQFDETGNVKNKKEMQTRVQFWSNSLNCVINEHLATFFIEKSDATTLLKYLLLALKENDLLIQNVLTLGRDGPNVNAKVFRLFQEELQKNKFKKLYDMGPCLIHAVHNAFLKGMQCFLVDIADFLIKVYYYFKDHHLRWENFTKIQESQDIPKHFFIKHVNTRWLTIGPAAERIIEQLPALTEYFLKYIPAKEATTTKKQTYIDIANYLNDKTLKSVLEFAVYASKLFTIEFTEKMQKAEPLIHVLYSQLRKLILLLSSDIIQPKKMKQNLLYETSTELLHKENLRSLEDINFGEKLKKSVSLLAQLEKLSFLNCVQKFYIKSITYLFEKIPNLRTLKNFECLVPEKIKSSNSINYIVNIAKLLPLVNIDVDILTQEWKLLCLDIDISFISKKSQRIDEYWSEIFSLQNGTDFRYPTITHVVKAALSLTHGSAPVERGFSTSARALTDDRANMDLQTLNSRLDVIDGINRFGSEACNIPLTIDLIKLTRAAHRSYMSYLDEQARTVEQQKKQKEMESEIVKTKKAVLENLKVKKDNVVQLEAQLEKAEKDWKSAIGESETMQTLIMNNNTSGKNKSEAVNQQLLNGLNALRKKETELRLIVEDLRAKLDKMKTKMIDTAIKKLGT